MSDLNKIRNLGPTQKDMYWRQLIKKEAQLIPDWLKKRNVPSTARNEIDKRILEEKYRAIERTAYHDNYPERDIKQCHSPRSVGLTSFHYNTGSNVPYHNQRLACFNRLQQFKIARERELTHRPKSAGPRSRLVGTSNNIDSARSDSTYEGMPPPRAFILRS